MTAKKAPAADTESITDKLTSRKFWITVGGFITLIATKQYTEATAVLLGYIGVEGVLDYRQG